MAVTTVTSGLNQTKGVPYTVITDSSADWAAVANDTYFYDIADGLPHYKDSSGTVLEVFSSAGASIYTADDTIGSGRIATLTDTLTFKKQPNNNALFIEQEVHSASDSSSLIHMESQMDNSNHQYKFITGQERGTGQNYFELTSKGDVNNSSNLGLGFYYSNAKTQGVNYSYVGIVTTNKAFQILADVGTKNVFNLYSGTNNITGRGYLQFRNYNDTADRIFLTRTGKNFINPDNVYESDAGLVVMGENYIGTEKISLQNRTAVQGADTLSTSTAFEIYDNDTTPTKLWDFRNNGDLIGSGARITNTIVNPTVQETTSTATLTINATNENTGVLTAQAAALTVANPTGTIVQGQKLVYRIKDNGTARAITWGANFRAIGVTLPTTTTANKLLYVGCIYNTTDSKWDVIAVNEEA